MLAGLRLIAVCTPVPANVAAVGTLLLETVSDPLRAPVAVGWKVIWIVQVAPGARLAGQVLLWEKSPVTLIDDICRVPLPVFESVTVWAVLAVFTSWSAKLRLAGDSEAMAVVPWPVRLVEALILPDVIDKEPVLGPDVKGENVTKIAQPAPVPRLVCVPRTSVQLSVAWKSPVTLTVGLNTHPWVAVKISVCVLEEPTTTEPKSSAVDESEAAGVVVSTNS